MTSYVDAALSDGESVVYRAALSHWKFALQYIVGMAMIFGAAALWFLAPVDPTTALIAGGLAAVIGVVVVLYAVIKRSTTELVLTNRRLILKNGLVARETIEMNLAKVESLRVTQSIVGRLLDFGDVSVVGTGSSLEPIRGIAHPLELRKRIGTVQ
jgi:uncharacterized membrane protein YdbT with pleckstrin-like domain